MGAGYVAGAIDYIDLSLLQSTAAPPEQIPTGIAQADEGEVAGRSCPRQQQIVGGYNGAAKGVHHEMRDIHVVTEVNPEVRSQNRVDYVS